MNYSLHEKCCPTEEAIDLATLLEKISQLSKVEQIEIYKILKKTDDKITENKNGIFINLSYISDETLRDIQAFVNYSLENKVRLEKLEELSEELIRKSIHKEEGPSLGGREPEQIPIEHNISSITNQARIKSNRMVAGRNFNKESVSDDEDVETEEKQLVAIKKDSPEDEGGRIVCGQQIEIDEIEKMETVETMVSEEVVESVATGADDIEQELEQNSQRKKYGGISAKILKKCKEYCRTNSYTSGNLMGFGIEDEDELGEAGNSIFDCLTDELQEEKL